MLILLFAVLGETFTSLHYLYRIPGQTIGKIVPETCDAIVDVLKDHMKVHVVHCACAR